MQIKVQILQTLCILYQSVKQETSLYYLLSNNYINQILLYDFKSESTEDIQDLYASLLKTLSLRLNIQSAQFFIVETNGSFPLLTRAIDLLHSKEYMVLAAAQTSILNILEVKDQLIQSYALRNEITTHLISTITNILNQQFNILIETLTMESFSTSFIDDANANANASLMMPSGDIALVNDKSKYNYMESRIPVHSRHHETKLRLIWRNLEDWIYFLNDLLSRSESSCHQLSEVLVRGITVHFLYPSLFDTFLFYSSHNAKAKAKVGANDEAKAASNSTTQDLKGSHDTRYHQNQDLNHRSEAQNLCKTPHSSSNHNPDNHNSTSGLDDAKHTVSNQIHQRSDHQHQRLHKDIGAGTHNQSTHAFTPIEAMNHTQHTAKTEDAPSPPSSDAHHRPDACHSPETPGNASSIPVLRAAVHHNDKAILASLFLLNQVVIITSYFLDSYFTFVAACKLFRCFMLSSANYSEMQCWLRCFTRCLVNNVKYYYPVISTTVTPMTWKLYSVMI